MGTYAASDSHTHGFLLYQGKFTTFMFPGSTDTIAHDINTTGTIVGDYTVGDCSPARLYGPLRRFP